MGERFVGDATESEDRFKDSDEERSSGPSLTLWDGA